MLCRFNYYSNELNPHSVVTDPSEAIRIHTKIVATSPVTVGIFDHHINHAEQPIVATPILAMSADALPVPNIPNYNSMTVVSIRHLAYGVQRECSKLMLPLLTVSGGDDKNIRMINNLYRRTRDGLKSQKDLRIFRNGFVHCFQLNKSIILVLSVFGFEI